MISVTWFDHKREPQAMADPAYPRGIEVDLRKSKDAPGCSTELPYPAPRCGIYLVVCDKCGYSAAVTTAGRTDDPNRVTLACKSN